jgi:hypothetical protein
MGKPPRLPLCAGLLRPNPRSRLHHRCTPRLNEKGRWRGKRSSCNAATTPTFETPVPASKTDKFRCPRCKTYWLQKMGDPLCRRCGDAERQNKEGLEREYAREHPAPKPPPPPAPKKLFCHCCISYRGFVTDHPRYGPICSTCLAKHYGRTGMDGTASTLSHWPVRKQRSPYDKPY